MALREQMTKQKIRLIYGIWWASCLAGHFSLLLYQGYRVEISLVDAVFSIFSIGLSALITNNFYRFYQPGATERFHRVIWGAGLAALSTVVQYNFLNWYFNAEAHYIVFLNGSVAVRFLFSLLIISFVTVSSWLLSSMQKQQEEEERRNSSENLSKEAELARLRQQLQPHFLFNSLNSVNALIGSNPEEARKMVQALSDFMRLNLRKDDNLIPFSEELQHLKLYLEIEKVRFGHRLQVDLDLEEDTKNSLLPPLLLQPVVENAIKFGLYNVTGNVLIRIRARMVLNMLEINTENPFDPETASASRGTGFGLSSVQRRLFLLFGRNDLLKTSSDKNIYTTKILIPQLK